MKALYFKTHAGPTGSTITGVPDSAETALPESILDVLHYGDLPHPTPAPGELLIKVRAAALNQLDLWVLRGWKGLSLTFPHSGGADIAGDVVEINGECPGVTVGDRVVVAPGGVDQEASPGSRTPPDQDPWCLTGEDSLSPHYRIIGEHLTGGFAEFVRVPAGRVLPLPPEVSYERGAAHLLVGTTVWRMLFTRGKLQPGESVLVVGSGGGVNSLSVLVALHHGAKVIALAGGAEKKRWIEDVVAQFLAKHPVTITAQGEAPVPTFTAINYHTTPEWHREVRALTGGAGVDLAVDNVGAATLPRTVMSLRGGGRVVTVGNTSGPQITLDNRHIFSRQLSIIGSTMGSHRDFLESAEWCFKHDLTPLIDKRFPLSEGKEGYRYLLRGESKGKILVIP